jgi:hypothetical protein
MTIYKVLLYHCYDTNSKNDNTQSSAEKESITKCQLITWDSLTNTELFEIKSIIIEKFNMDQYANVRTKKERHIYNDGDIFFATKELKKNLNIPFIIKTTKNGKTTTCLKGEIVTKEMATEKYDRAGLIQPYYSHDSIQPRFITEMSIDEFLKSTYWITNYVDYDLVKPDYDINSYLKDWNLISFPIPNPNPIYDNKEKKAKIWHYNRKYLSGPLHNEFISKVLKLYVDSLSKGLTQNEDDRYAGLIKCNKEAFDKLTGKVILYENPHYKSYNGNHAVIYLC